MKLALLSLTVGVVGGCLQPAGAPDDVPDVDLVDAHPDTTPGDTTPTDVAPIDAAPIDVAPIDVPLDVVPEDTAPMDTEVPLDTDAPEVDTAPEDVAPVDTAHEDTVPEDTIPEDTLPEDTLPEDTVPEDTGVPLDSDASDALVDSGPTDTVTSGECPVDMFLEADECVPELSLHALCTESRECAGRCVEVYYPYAHPYDYWAVVHIPEGSRVCVPCLASSDCSEPEICTPEGTCRPPLPDGAACASHEQCEHLCGGQNTCGSPVEPLPDGEGCKVPSHCQSGVCQFGRCGLCVDDGDCPAHHFCGADGLCAEDRPDGAPCDETRQCAGQCVANTCAPCSDTASCGGLDICTPGGVCGPPQRDGAPCETQHQCEHLCDPVALTCQLALGPGVCLVDEDCHTDWYCDQPTHTCAKRRGPGATCSKDRQCLFDCESGACGPAPSCETQEECPTGTFCEAYGFSSYTCVRIRHSRASCYVDVSQPYPDACESGVCTDPSTMYEVASVSEVCTMWCPRYEYADYSRYHVPVPGDVAPPTCRPLRLFGDSCLLDIECASGNCHGEDGMVGYCE